MSYTNNNGVTVQMLASPRVDKGLPAIILFHPFFIEQHKYIMYIGKCQEQIVEQKNSS